jgi:hypothetical protein
MAAAARMRCCTSLLYGTTGASINPAGCEAPTRFQVCAAGAGVGHGVRDLECFAHRIWLLGVVVQRVSPTGGYA